DGRALDLVRRMRLLGEREADEIARRFPKLLRRVGGYNIETISPQGHNMAHLLVGSEGTLGFFRRIEVDLQPIPPHKVLGVCHFPTFYQAMEMTRHIVALEPAAVELVDRTMIDLARDIAAYRPTIEAFVEGAPDALLLVEFAGENGDEQARRLADLVARREAARAEGRQYGIGYSVVVEPSISNMGYITTLLSPEQRERSGPKNGALATATVGFDPSGAISVAVSSVPQGQGHRTVLAQVAADVFGLEPKDVAVMTEHDTGKDAWSIASGNYSSRFAGAVAGATHTAAMQLRDRLTLIAAADLNVPPEDVAYGEGRIFAATNPDNALPLGRSAAKAHWSPLSVPDGAGAGLRETAFWNMPELAEPDEGDRINSSGAYGFIFDFCGVEIDPDTFAVRVDKYVTMHDAGRLLNPMLAGGQIRGGFAHGLGAALLEELSYGPDGGFQAGTLADYLAPTVMEVPELTILHDQSPSPFTPLGAKGLGEGNAMSTPVCIANAVSDALGADITSLPLTRSNLAELMLGEEPPGRTETFSGHALEGQGSTVVPAAPEKVWSVLLDDTKLAAVIPGCHELVKTGDNAYRADVTLGVGPIKGRFTATVALQDLDPPNALSLIGAATGPLGRSEGEGNIRLRATKEGTQVNYTYTVRISGKVAAVGGRMMDGAARALINQFFKRLVSQVDDQPLESTPGLITRLLTWLGVIR
ncbi:MAG: molybdopterin-dependent oxidoreductase, partial [Rhodospirillaceae bacterium]|nr:molybdopterin-dependent oxidoreductase [Rhodospirillaceae bacterium]